MTGRCVIIAAGQMDITPLLPRPEQGDFIIAADAGIRNAAALGAAPDLVMGIWTRQRKRRCRKGLSSSRCGRTIPT